jgi:hypothetical protein
MSRHPHRRHAAVLDRIHHHLLFLLLFAHHANKPDSSGDEQDYYDEYD